MKCNISIISFATCAFGIVSKKPLPNPRSQIFIPVFSFQGFIVLGLTFRSVVHVELVLACGCVCPHFPAAFVEDCLSPLDCLSALVENKLMWGFLCGLPVH